jgi:glucose-6-phosphate dehydrogenase assembly protein OpcA
MNFKRLRIIEAIVAVVLVLMVAGYPFYVWWQVAS